MKGMKMKEEEGESKSSFLLRNALQGLLWLVVILVVFVLVEDFVVENFQRHIDVLKNKPLILFGIAFASEVVFGIIPPVLFMSIWRQLIEVPLGMYVFYLSVFFVISLAAAIIGYYIGRNFSRTAFYKRLEERYLLQYNSQLRKYGIFLVIVAALTPVPYSATCMLAGSVDIPFRQFLLAAATRVFYFLVYGWVAWSFPSFFS